MVKSDFEMLHDLGRFLKSERLRQNITQQELANHSGLGRRTITQLENGEGGTISSLLRMLYALKRQDVWSIFETSPIVSPLLMAKIAKAEPKRARKRKGKIEVLKPLDW